MRYHYFTKGYPHSHLYIAGGEICIYCNKCMFDLHDSLSYTVRQIAFKLLKNNPNRRALEEEFYAINAPCKFGLTKEEYIIKEIIE